MVSSDRYVPVPLGTCRYPSVGRGAAPDDMAGPRDYCSAAQSRRVRQHRRSSPGRRRLGKTEPVPLLAHLTAEIRCPKCSDLVADTVQFQWAYCRGYRAVPETSYRVGDEVRWRICPDGSIPAWSFFGDGDGNVGDPDVRNVIVRDCWLEDALHGCGEVLGGVALEVREGTITRVWGYASGDFDNSSFFYVPKSDGTKTPMPGWDDHSWSRVDPAQCGDPARYTVPVRDDR